MGERGEKEIDVLFDSGAIASFIKEDIIIDPKVAELLLI